MKRVVIVEDHTAVRQMIGLLVDSMSGYTVVGGTGDGQQACELCLDQRPDLVILDIMLPGLNGIEVLKRFGRRLRKTRVLIFSGYRNSHLVKSCMLSGAHGYIEKTGSLEKLKEVIEIVAGGGTYYGQDSMSLLKAALDPEKNKNNFDQLTARERETLQLIAEGLSTKQIAKKLSISVKTAENHRTNLMRKLDLHNAAAITRYAFDIGLVENTPRL